MARNDYIPSSEDERIESLARHRAIDYIKRRGVYMSRDEQEDYITNVSPSEARTASEIVENELKKVVQNDTDEKRKTMAKILIEDIQKIRKFLHIA